MAELVARLVFRGPHGGVVIPVGSGLTGLFDVIEDGPTLRLVYRGKSVRTDAGLDRMSVQQVFDNRGDVAITAEEWQALPPEERRAGGPAIYQAAADRRLDW